LLECPLYENERVNLMRIAKQFIPNINNENNSNQFILIMTSEENEVLKELGKFVACSFKKRNMIILE
jgi:hypothetical protein